MLDDEQESGETNTLYKYRDFSTMPEEQDTEEEAAAAQRGSLESSIRVQKFPVKLYAILAQKEFHDIITWMPHGRSWKVLKPNLFESMVMPLFFEYSNYHSFNRLVNAWSFRRISSGPDRGSYYHELFLRGKPHLQKYMRRLPKTHKKLPMKKEDEPDFYKMDKECSLPPLEEITLSAAKMQGGLRGQQSLAMAPIPPSQGMQRSHQRMFNEPSQDSYEQQEGFMGRIRSPAANAQMPGMRDPANFKNTMEFKPVPLMDGVGNGFGPQMMMGGQGPQPQMMGSMNSMNPQMMGGQNSQMMMGGQQMNPQMNGMNPQMNQQMGMGMGMGSHMMMGGQQMNSQMNGMNQQMNPQMGQMGQMAGPMGQTGSNSQQFYNLQRLRQMQQMQFDGRMNGPMPVSGGGEEGFGRMSSYRPQHC